MKLLLPMGMLFIALSFCGLGDMLSKSDEDKTDTVETTDGEKDSGDDSTKDVVAAELSSDMKAALEGGDKIVWEEQGMEWQVPKGWPKMSSSKNMLNYGSPSKGFLIVTISSLPASFTPETREMSMKGTYDQQVQKAKEGGNEKVQWTLIDGAKGVEFVEAMPEDKGDPRRHQWIGYREYNNQIQMVNVMVSTDGSKFDANKDTYNAILYSMKMAKQ